MNSASKDIANILDGESSLGLTLGTDLFYYRMHPTPINQVVVYNNPGNAPLLGLKKAFSAYYYASVSIHVRNTNEDTAHNLAHDIMVYLHASGGITESGTIYTLIRALSDVQFLHRDENDNPVYVVNFEVQRKSA